jgi:Domain of unknown function (DUF4340)
MMKTHRTNYTLLVLFFASLLVLWGLEYSGVRTTKERRHRESLILPELVETPAIEIRKISIERGKERLVFERRGTGAMRWQIIEPLSAAAEPSRLETLVRNLKEARRSLDAGSITGSAATFGLDHPEATVRLWGGPTESAGNSAEPLATIDVGKTVGRLRYVRPGESGEIDVADAKLFAAVDQPVAEWRERALMGIPTFQVGSIAIKQGERVIRVERGRNGRFRLVEPLVAPANGPKVESLLAAVSSLRVADGAKGFAADDAKDLSPFGLSPPVATIEVTTAQGKDQPQVLHIGKPVPGKLDRVYARQGDQDDVVILSAQPLAELPQTAVALRSQKVADFEPIAVSEIRIKSPGHEFLLKKDSKEWLQKEPHEEKADVATIAALLRKIASLETSEFLDAGKVRDPQLAPPLVTIQIRETRLSRSAPTSAADELVLDLHIGRLDGARKVFYAQLANDSAVLTLPDSINDVLPKNAMAFRDRSVADAGPSGVRKLIITRAGRTDELVPEQSGQPNRWRMRRPIDAAADTRSVTEILAVLANLRAEDFVADSQKDAVKFGLNEPILEVGWETDRMHRLKVGAQVPRKPSYFAAIEGEPAVFILAAETLKPFEAEFRDHVVMSFPPASSLQLVLTWSRPNRTVSLVHRQPTAKGQLEWVAEPGSDANGIDLSAASALTKALSHLETVHFTQYDGEIPAFTGLTRPRLTATVKLEESQPARVLRIGHAASPGLIYAAEGTADSGPVFLLPGPSWDSLIRSGERFEPFPKDVFAPAR